MITKHLVWPTVFCLSACSGSQDAPLSLLNDDAKFIVPLVDAEGASVRQAGTENGYAFQVGLNDQQSEFVTQATLIEGTDVGRPLASGSANMTGTFLLETLEDPATDAFGLISTRRNLSEEITLNVDFLDRRISGASAGLSLDGQFENNGSLLGTATFDGMHGDLAGQVGADTSIGVFNGHSTTGVFAGGYIVESTGN